MKRGGVPLAFLDLITERKDIDLLAGYQHGTDHHHEVDGIEYENQTEDIVCDVLQPIVQRSHRSAVTSTIGWICWEGLIFDAERISCWLSELYQKPGSLRLKAVIRTNEGWWGFNFVDKIKEIQANGYRRDSRLEMIIESDQFPDVEALENKLRDCLVNHNNNKNKNDVLNVLGIQ